MVDDLSPLRTHALKRREALKRIATSAGVLGAAGLGGRAILDRGGLLAGAAQHSGVSRMYPGGVLLGAPDMVVSRGKADDSGSYPKPDAIVKKAVEAMGGMARFVSRGDVVVIKPNIGWDRMPVHAANTNPEVVASLIRLAFDAGAKTVRVADGSCNDANRCFQRSGIWKAASKLGADVVLPAEHRYRTMRLKQEVLDEWPVFTALIDADKIINVPVAKHHNLAKYTGAMKNWYGVLGGRRNRLHQNIDVSIADLATFMRPTLTVIDAIRVLMRNGPQGGNIDDAKDMHTVIAAVDQVAADALACSLIGQKRENIAYLAMADARGIGTSLYENLKVVEV